MNELTTKVIEFINNNIFHSKEFDVLTEEQKVKAINNAKTTLYSFYTDYDEEKKPLPINVIALQTVWTVRKDESILKSELGVSSQSIEGLSISYRNTPEIIAPEVKHLFKKRVGSYGLNINNTFREIIYNDYRYTR